MLSTDLHRTPTDLINSSSVQKLASNLLQAKSLHPILELVALVLGALQSPLLNESTERSRHIGDLDGDSQLRLARLSDVGNGPPVLEVTLGKQSV